MSKEYSPIAAAIIGALLPFVNEEDKQGLNATFATVKSTGAEATAKMQQQVSDATEAAETPVGTVWALASCGDFLIPFDDRIHGMTKDDDKNDIPKVSDKTGVFAKKRGVSPKDFMKIEGELVDQHGKDKTEWELGDDGQPVSIGGTSEPEAEEKPQRPARPGAKTEDKPARPGGNRPARPGGAQNKPAEDEDRKAALTSINVLTKEYGVNYDFIVEQLLSEHGVDSFQDLAPEFNKTVARDSKAWVDFLRLITDMEDWFKAKDEEHGETSHEQFEEFLTEYNINSVSELARDQLSAFHTSVEELKTQWVAFLGE